METKDVRIEKLTADPRNARKHSERNLAAIRTSLESFGQQKPIVVSQDGVVVAGNGTLAAAVELGWETVAVVETALDTLDAKAYAVADNRTAELAEWDDAELAQVLDQLDESQLGAVGFSDEELAEICERFAPDISTSRLDEAEAQTDKAEELNEKWKVRSGDLWQIGDHRLLCGDSTNADDMARLMGKTVADMGFTSPPYNSGVGGYKSDYGGKKKSFYLDESVDSKTPEEYKTFLVEVMCVLSTALGESSPLLWNISYTAKTRKEYGEVIFGGGHPFGVKESIIWDKGNGFPTATKGILSRRAEFIFVLSQGNKYTTTQRENEVRWNVWEISTFGAGNTQHESHGATFPVTLAEKSLLDFSQEGTTCLDPFLGSGTTMVAAEQLNRKCYGMEISPTYCAVILERMAGMGLSPARIGNE